MILSNRNDPIVYAVNGKASKIRNGNTSPIKYTIFSFYSQIAHQLGETDWEELFNNFSRGSFNKGFKFLDENTISVKTATGIQKMNVIPPSQELIQQYYVACKDFIKKTSGIFNSLDDDFDFAKVPQMKKEDISWSGTIPASRQVAMITAFVNEASLHYRLSESKKEELIENILGKIFIGELSGSEIYCENFNVMRIDGLTFSEGNFHITSKPTKQVQKSKKRTTTTTCSLEQPIDQQKVFTCSRNLSQSLRRRYGGL